MSDLSPLWKLQKTLMRSIWMFTQNIEVPDKRSKVPLTKAVPFAVRVNKASGPVYTKRQRQRCDNSVMTLVILFSLKTVESLKMGFNPHSGATPILDFRCKPYSVIAVVKF